MNDQVIAEIGKNALEKVIVGIREFKGHRFLDLRIYYLDDNDEWKPSRKGVTFGLDQVGELLEAIQAIAAKLEEAA